MGKLSFAERIKNLFSSKKVDTEDFFEDLTDNLIEGDVGAKTSYEIADLLEKKCRKEHITSESDILNELKLILKEYVKLKDLDGVILYSEIETRTEYKVIYGNDVLMRQEVDTFIGNINIEKEYIIDKINGVDFQETSKFKVSDFYVFYKKN